MKFSQIDEKFSCFIHEIRTSIICLNSSKVTIKLLNHDYFEKMTTGQTQLPLVADREVFPFLSKCGEISLLKSVDILILIMKENTQIC